MGDYNYILNKKTDIFKYLLFNKLLLYYFLKFKGLSKLKTCNKFF